MINQNILTMFKSHQSDPPFSILVTNIEQKEECGQESITITVHQVNKPISEIEEDSNVVSRKLNIIGELDIDDNELYKTKLVGYSFDEEKINPIEPTTGILDRYIEILDVKLQKTINIEFNKEYKEQPKIIVNLPKEYEQIYRNMSTDFITKEKEINDEKIKYWSGVTLTFNGLKTKKTYPIAGIIIIGDKEEE